MLRLLGHDTVSEMEAAVQGATAQRVPWEADVTPVPARIANEPTGRPAAVMLVADGFVLASDIVLHPPSNAAGVATLIGNAVSALVAKGGAPPSSLTVRHEAVAELLRPMMLPLGVKHIQAFRALPALDDAASSLRQHMAGSESPLPAVSLPETWAGWEFPAERVHALHAAAATWYAMKPWELLSDSDLLELTLPGGSRWYASIMGAGGETFGLALYENVEDVIAVLDASPHQPAFAPLFVVLSLTFDFRADLPKPMRREAMDAGWPIAGPSAYPVMWAMNTMGGGVSPAQAADLTLALEIVARFAERLDPESGQGAEPLIGEWTDAVSGAVVNSAMPQRFMSLWDVPAHLSPIHAEGARANADAVCLTDAERDTPSEEDAALVSRFVQAARAMGVAEKRVSLDEGNARHFIEVMRFEQRVHLAAVTEFDLRLFLFDLVPRHTVGSKSHGHALRQSLKRFFAYLAASEDLSYPWAATILADKQAFDDRWASFPGRYANEAEEFGWTAELSEDLVARAMLPEPPVDSDLSGTVREQEAALYQKLQRAWLRWRDDAIHDGVTEFAALLARLRARQKEWEAEPQAELDGRSPADVITAERSAGRRISRRRR